MAISDMFKKTPQTPAADEGKALLSAELADAPPSLDGHEPPMASENTALAPSVDVPEVPALPPGDVFAVPLLGLRTAAAHQRLLSMLLALALVVLAVMVFLTVYQTGKGSQQVAAVGQSLMQSQRLAKSVSQALIGNAEAFPELKESAAALSGNVHGLQSGSPSVPALGDA